MVNHGGISANAKTEWFFWNEDASVLTKYPEELFASATTPVFLAYRAVRAISTGEEITIDYGHAWAKRWKAFDSRNPLFEGFRESIEAPVNLFPEHWTGI